MLDPDSLQPLVLQMRCLQRLRLHIVSGAGVTEKVQAGVEGKVQEEAGAKHRSKVGG